jgi:CheY-like chemotaxis protein
MARAGRASEASRIVMIEDNPGDVRILRFALDQHGEEYELEVLTNGNEAIRFVQEQRMAASRKPCVILLDCHLPKHNGAEVLRAVRQEPALTDVHVVTLTSSVGMEDEKEILRMGVRLCRNKPTDLDDWIALAGEILAICREPNSAVVV